MNIKTKSGFTIDVNPKKVRDWRFIGILAKMDKCKNEAEQIDYLKTAVEMLLGEKGEQKLCRHVEKDGVADALDVISEFREIISLCGDEAKK